HPAVTTPATPTTIEVLGRIVIIDGAPIVAGDEEEGVPLTCDDLVPPETVEVQFATDGEVDIPGGMKALTATLVRVRRGDAEDDEVGDSGGDESAVQVLGPVQKVTSVTDPTSMLTTTTVTVLGIDIDVTNAALEGANDDDSGEDQPIDLTQVVEGVFIKLTLASASPPFAATELEVKNFDNHVDVEVVGPDGGEIDDHDEGGNPVNDVDVEATETVKVRVASGVSGSLRVGHARRVRRVLHFHTRSNGSVVLSGLPIGQLKIRATRVV